MPVASGVDGTHDRRVSPPILIDDGADRRCLHQRNIDERHKRRYDSRTIDHSQAGEHRRELARIVLVIDDEPRRGISLRQVSDHGIGLVTDDDDHIVHVGVVQCPDDPREKCLVAAERQH